MQFGKRHTMGNRKHGNVHRGILLPAMDGQSPEVRRRPGKNNQHQQQPVSIDLTGDGGPAQQRGCSACKASDNNVLGGRPLQEHRIDHGISQQRCKSKPGCKSIYPDQQYGHPQTADNRGKQRRLTRAHTPLCNRAFISARHLLVDTLIHQVIYRGGRARTQGDAEVAENQDMQWHHAGHGHKHTDSSSENHQEHYVGFRQLLVIPP